MKDGFKNTAGPMAEAKTSELMEKIVSLCKRRGFIFQSSEIYGGINGFWDYGPLGAELKRNIKERWWNDMTRQRDDVAGLEATIIMSPQIWKASGHVDTFSDPMIDCKTCKGRFRADQIAEIPCPQKPSKMVCECHGEKTEPRKFNLMFKTYVGPVESEDNVAYLRPETAQAIFAQFKNVLETSRQKVPFGIAQIGKAFRNEINPRNFTFRSREFEQMELEFFIKPDEAVEAIAAAWRRQPKSALGGIPAKPQPNWGWEAWHKYWVEERVRFTRASACRATRSVEYWQKPEELAHYARACVDILYKFPFSKRDEKGELKGEELEGIAARSDFDLEPAPAFFRQADGACLTRNCRAAWAEARRGEKQAELWERYYETRLKYLSRRAKRRSKAEKQAREDAEALAKGNYVPHVIEPSRGRGPAGAGADLQRLLRGPGAGRKRQNGNARRHAVSSAHRADQGRRVSAAQEQAGTGGEGEGSPRFAAAAHGVFYDEAGAIGRRYRRQDEAGTPFGVTIDFDTLGEKGAELKDTVTLRDRDSMKQERVKISELLPLLSEKIR